MVSMISLASAADMPIYKARPPVVAVFSWTGFYAGLNAGYAWGDGSGTMGTGFAVAAISGSLSGFVGGGQIGYNWQMGSWVFGVETDLQGSAAKGTVTATAPGYSMLATEKLPWFGSIRGRLGYAFDRTMVYATGGAVYGSAELTGTDTALGPFSNSITYWTWTIGGGIEQMFMPNWSAKIEYLYVGSPNKVPVPPTAAWVDGSEHANIIRAGINYHF
jgi:outer membrane immunogenic protein